MSTFSRSISCLTANEPEVTDEKAVTDETKKPDDAEVQQGDLINGLTSRYRVLDFLGQGSFGKVAKCSNVFSSKEVALKIITAEKKWISEREIAMLELVSVLDPVKTNVVQFFEQFEHKGSTCLTFEMLDRSLYQLLSDRDFKPLSLNEIRPIADQLLTAFEALKIIGVVHSDLKLDNVMLVNHEEQPFRVKLIDFGVSFHTSEDMQNVTIQPLDYRAPEVHLGLPVSEAIDMWSLGLLLSVLYLATDLFVGSCVYQLLRSIVAILGQPADRVLNKGRYTRKYFRENKNGDDPKWWLKTSWEYQMDSGIYSVHPSQRSVTSLDDLITFYPGPQESIETEDRRAFVSLLKCLFNLDPEQRITPEEALQHPFVSMAHLREEKVTSLYVDDSFKKMMVCLVDDSEEKPDDEAEEEPEDEGPPVVPCSSPAGSVTPGSYDGMLNVPDGAAAAGAEVRTGSAEEESAVSLGAASRGPAEDTLATDGSPDEGVLIEVKQSRLKRIRKFFSRAIRTIFRRKK